MKVCLCAAAFEKLLLTNLFSGGHEQVPSSLTGFQPNKNAFVFGSEGNKNGHQDILVISRARGLSRIRGALSLVTTAVMLAVNVSAIVVVCESQAYSGRPMVFGFMGRQNQRYAGDPVANQIAVSHQHRTRSVD